MPAIPESTRSPIILRLLDHAEHNWPQLAKVQARYRGSFAYMTGVPPGGEQIPLFRLRYGGSAHSFGFAIYSPARDSHEDAVLLTGLPIGSLQEALDTCTVHLAAPGHQPDPRPPTNSRCHPLRSPDRIGIPPGFLPSRCACLHAGSHRGFRSPVGGSGTWGSRPLPARPGD